MIYGACIQHNIGVEKAWPNELFAWGNKNVVNFIEVHSCVQLYFVYGFLARLSDECRVRGGQHDRLHVMISLEPVELCFEM